MVASALTNFSSLLSDYLKMAFKLNEDIVSLRPLSGNTEKSPDNKVHIFLTNVERETSAGISFNRKNIPGGNFGKTSPAWQLNLYILIACVFGEKQYEESLYFLSAITSFLQSNNSFPVPQTDGGICIDPVNLSFSELSNLWSIHGNQYYPSVLCRLRTVIIDENEIKHIGRVISEKDVTI